MLYCLNWCNGTCWSFVKTFNPKLINWLIYIYLCYYVHLSVLSFVYPYVLSFAILPSPTDQCLCKFGLVNVLPTVLFDFQWFDTWLFKPLANLHLLLNG
jgi:hypothetical protein